MLANALPIVSYTRLQRSMPTQRQRGFKEEGGFLLSLTGPLTLRMMLRVWSSMNSTRTCVTPPRDPR